MLARCSKMEQLRPGAAIHKQAVIWEKGQRCAVAKKCPVGSGSLSIPFCSTNSIPLGHLAVAWLMPKSPTSRYEECPPSWAYKLSFTLWVMTSGKGVPSSPVGSGQEGGVSLCTLTSLLWLKTWVPLPACQHLLQMEESTCSHSETQL